MESYQSNGNDVLKVHSMAIHAVHKARQGDGPTFLEFKTYRWREHCGTNYDHQLGYRTESDVLEWQQRCPIENLKKKFIRDGILNSQNIKKMEKELEAEIKEAVVFAKQAPFPQEQALLENIYAP
jgi:pyruvate dehydrogenase E1 component alpha subunit